MNWRNARCGRKWFCAATLASSGMTARARLYRSTCSSVAMYGFCNVASSDGNGAAMFDNRRGDLAGRRAELREARDVHHGGAGLEERRLDDVGDDEEPRRQCDEDGDAFEPPMATALRDGDPHADDRRIEDRRLFAAR